jgi:hypothetical protein
MRFGLNVTPPASPASRSTTGLAGRDHAAAFEPGMLCPARMVLIAQHGAAFVCLACP